MEAIKRSSDSRRNLRGVRGWPAAFGLVVLGMACGGWAGMGGLAVRAAEDALMPAEIARALSDAYADVADRVGPSVVGIITTVTRSEQGRRGGDAEDWEDENGDDDERFGIPDDLRRFFEGGGPFNLRRSPQPRRPSPAPRIRGMGCGVILDEKGHILTNNHVIEGAGKITVRLDNGGSHPAELVGADKESDLAVIRLVDFTGKLAPATLGDSDALRVGNIVIAIGAPFSQTNSFSLGIVSGKNRQLDAIQYENYIQTDAAINPGNSGGPLVNLAGDVMGINTIISTRSGDSAGVGFAVPSSLAKNVVRQLIEKGSVTRGWIGVTMSDLSDPMRAALNVPEGGVLVVEAMDGGPAAKAGVMRSDVILSFNGKTLKKARDLTMAVADVEPGKSAPMVVLRGSETITLELILEKRDPELVAAKNYERLGGGRRDGRSAPSSGPSVQSESLGFTLRPMRDDERRLFGEEKGLVISRIDPRSLAREAGIDMGFLIIEINRKPCDSLDAFRAIDKAIGAKDAVFMLVCPPRGDPTFVAINLAERQ